MQQTALHMAAPANVLTTAVALMNHHCEARATFRRTVLDDVPPLRLKLCILMLVRFGKKYDPHFSHVILLKSV
jgi:hypothetical protein